MDFRSSEESVDAFSAPEAASEVSQTEGVSLPNHVQLTPKSQVGSDQPNLTHERGTVCTEDSKTVRILSSDSFRVAN